MKTYNIEIFDKRAAYGLDMPVLQFEATSMEEAYQTVLENLGLTMEIQS